VKICLTLGCIVVIISNDRCFKYPDISHSKLAADFNTACLWFPSRENVPFPDQPTHLLASFLLAVKWIVVCIFFRMFE
jgi:hypothetical protein